jgi:peroxiredoxin
MENKGIGVGKKAKDFILRDQKGQEFILSEYPGRKVLLSFHPLAWTPICANQMKDLEKNRKVFERYNTIAVGVSVDSVACKAAWAKSLKIHYTRLLADFWPHGAVAKSLGILRTEGFSERANIIIDEKGKVSFVKIYPIKELPDIKEIIQLLMP